MKTPFKFLYIGLLISLLGLTACNQATTHELEEQPALIPLPNQIEWLSNKAYTFGNHNTLSIPKEVENRDLLAEQLNATLQEHGLPT